MFYAVSFGQVCLSTLNSEPSQLICPMVPSRRRLLNRCLNRPLKRGNSRRLVRRIVRGPRVDHLRQALAAFGRAVRARRRLIKLDPTLFDAALVSRLAEEHRLAGRRRREAEVALVKVFGPPEPHHGNTADRSGNGAETVRFSRRRVLRIEGTLAEYEMWMDAGRLSFTRYERCQSHRPASLSTLVRLIEIATQFGRLASGMDVSRPASRLLEKQAKFDRHAVPIEEALKRVYGTVDCGLNPVSP